MAEVERLLRLEGCAMINLNVSTTNKAVSDFYRRIGFSQVEVITLSWNSTCNQKQIASRVDRVLGHESEERLSREEMAR